MNFDAVSNRAGWAPDVAARRRVDPADLAFARSRRARGQGWQTIANQLGCNAEDLRRCVEGETQLVATSVPAALIAQGLKRGSGFSRALLAIAAGAPSCAAAALEAEVREETFRGYLVKLKTLGLVGDRTRSGWPLTGPGRAAVKALKAASEADRG